MITWGPVIQGKLADDLQAYERRFMAWADPIAHTEYGVVSCPQFILRWRATHDGDNQGWRGTPYDDNLAYNAEVYRELRQRYHETIERYPLNV